MFLLSSCVEVGVSIVRACFTIQFYLLVSSEVNICQRMPWTMQQDDISY
jgi:hypothetical protein